jgi:hypothetical protein
LGTVALTGVRLVRAELRAEAEDVTTLRGAANAPGAVCTSAITAAQIALTTRTRRKIETFIKRRRHTLSDEGELQAIDRVGIVAKEL